MKETGTDGGCGVSDDRRGLGTQMPEFPDMFDTKPRDSFDSEPHGVKWVYMASGHGPV